MAPAMVLHHMGLRAPLMAMNMAFEMAVWMRHRGHGWLAIVVISAAMFVSLAVLIGPFWAGLLSGDGLLRALNVLLIPAMVVAMPRRRDECARRHRHHHTTLPGRVHRVGAGRHV